MTKPVPTIGQTVMQGVFALAAIAPFWIPGISGYIDVRKARSIPVPAANQLHVATGILETPVTINQHHSRRDLSPSWEIGLLLTRQNEIIPFSCRPYQGDQLNCMYPDDWVRDHAVGKQARISYYAVPTEQYPSLRFDFNDGRGPRQIDPSTANVVMEAYYLDSGQRHYLVRYADSVSRMNVGDNGYALWFLLAVPMTMIWLFIFFQQMRASIRAEIDYFRHTAHPENLPQLTLSSGE